MKICNYSSSGSKGDRAGVVEGDKVYPLGEALVKAGLLKDGYSMVDVVAVLGNNDKAMAVARDTAKLGSPVALSSVKLLAPVPVPPVLWCAASNYKAHQEEMKERVGSNDRSAYSKDELMAEFFIKPNSSIIGPGGTVILPKVSRHVDFECELCAVIGKPARKVTEEKAHDYIFGYTMCWDLSQRDPWGKGVQNTRNIRKGFDTFTGLGPWIVTRDEIADPQDLNIRVEQNGKEAMVAHTGDMICNLRDHIRFLSDVVTLQPGVLITTGTPAGVQRLAPGDKLKGTISKIGSMELNVEAEK
jgi:2-keto-4-pentenoate hydratase/2-oxohepta-3-ene-1,7-dioic acid hydratase in catechol pathway